MSLMTCAGPMILAGIAGTVLGLTAFGAEPASGPMVVTVTGEVSADSLGMVLPHEHVMVDFVGADKCDKSRYDADEVLRAVLPFLERAHMHGVGTLVECTPQFLARDPALLKRLSVASGLKILTNTGLYGAAGDKFLPALRRCGFTEAQISQIVKANPRRAFARQVRRAAS